MKKAAHQHDLWREHVQTRRDCLSVFAENTRTFLDDPYHASIAAGRSFKYDRRKHCDFHLICRLRPADEFVEIVQGKCPQNFCGELHFAAMQIVFAQNETQRLNNEKIAAARVSKHVSPTAGLLDLIAASPSYRRAAAGIDDDPLAASERRGQTGIAIVSGNDFRGPPNFAAETGEYGAIFQATTGEKNPGAINLLW